MQVSQCAHFHRASQTQGSARQGSKHLRNKQDTRCTNTSVLWGGEAVLPDLNSHLDNMKLCNQRTSETTHVPWQEHFSLLSSSLRPALAPFVRKKPEYHVLGSKAVHIHLFWIIYSHYQRKGQQKTIGHCRQGAVKFNTCVKMQEWCTFGLLGTAFKTWPQQLLSEMTVEEDAVISQCCWVQLSKKGKALRKECSVLPNKDMLAPYRDTNPGSTSICFVPVSLTISHIYVLSAAAKCGSETEETCTGNSRNTFILCQNTICCQLKKGILTPRAGVTFCLQNCTRSQRLHRTWKQ